MTHNQKGFSHILILLIIVAVGVVGFAGWRVVNNRPDNRNNQSLLNQTTLPDDLSGVKPIDEIMALAQNEIRERSISQIELIQEAGSLVYVIELSDKTILVFNANSGEKLSVTVDQQDEDGDIPLPAGFRPAVSLQDALTRAKAEHSGISIRKVDLEVEDGVAVYSIRFTDKFRVDIDATDGTVLRIKSTDGPDVKIRDNDNDIDDDTIKNDIDDDNDNNSVKNNKDDDDEGDGVKDAEDNDDDNDGIKDSSGSTSGNSGRGSSNSGSESGSSNSDED